MALEQTRVAMSEVAYFPANLQLAYNYVKKVQEVRITYIIQNSGEID